MPSSLSSCETPWLQTIKGAMSEDDFQRLCTGNMLKPVAKMLEKLDESKKISKTNARLVYMSAVLCCAYILCGRTVPSA